MIKVPYASRPIPSSAPDAAMNCQLRVGRRRKASASEIEIKGTSTFHIWVCADQKKPLTTSLNSRKIPPIATANDAAHAAGSFNRRNNINDTKRRMKLRTTYGSQPGIRSCTCGGISANVSSDATVTQSGLV